MLELKNIEKSFDNVNVLNHVNFSVEDGEIVSILGSSGSGKTTLLNIILGITQPDSGEIFFDTHDITKVSMENRGFNIAFQDYALFPNLNAYENIVYGLRNKPNISTPEEALSLSDKVMIINGGTILQYAKPDEIINAPSDSFVTEFILRQLEIKRNNILALFGGNKAVAVV